MQLDSAAIEKAVIAEVAERIINEGDLNELVRKQVTDRLHKMFDETFAVTAQAQIEQAVKDGFNHSFRPIDNLGRPTGPETTIADKLSGMIKGYWSEMVDKAGKPTTSTWDKPMTRAEWMLTKIVAADFTDHVKQQTVNVTASLKDGLRAELRGWMDRMLADLFRVKSADDNREGRVA